MLSSGQKSLLIGGPDVQTALPDIGRPVGIAFRAKAMTASRESGASVRRIWIAALCVTIMAGIVVPYFILGPGTHPLAAVAFWFVFGVFVIGLIAIGVMRWRDVT
jgi:hypothetical protein